MNDEIIFENVKFSDISINDKKKCNLSKSQYKILLENPFKESEDIPAQITAKSNDAIVGSVLCFPAKIIADKQIYVCNSGSSLYVNPNFRGHGIGTKLGIKRLNVSKNKISLAAGLSNMSLPIYKKLGCFIFYPARYNLICNSKVLLNKNSKDPIFTVLSIILNSILKIQQYLIITYTKTHLCHFNIYEINEATDEIEEIIKTDKHRFKELHNKEWFNWHLNNCMVEHPLNKLHLYMIKSKGKNIGFLMTKTRYKAEAGQGKIHNALIGTIIEWGSSNPQILDEKELIMLGVNILLNKKVDIIDIFSNDQKTIKLLKKSGFVHSGAGNFAVFVGDKSPLREHFGYEKEENWRIRPATSDNGLS